MIRRFLCLLLVPLMLTSQGLCFAHSHHAAEPEGHALRPHFHFGGHGHDESSHDESTHDHDHHADHSGHNPRPGEHDAVFPAVIAPIGDHDADAVYFGETVTFARKGNSVIVPLLSAKYITVATILRVADQSEGWLQRLGQPPSVFDAACPIYLRTLSLRI